MKPLLGGIKGKTSVLLSLPLFHAYGNFVQISAIYLGLRLLILPDPRDTDAILGIDHQITGLFLSQACLPNSCAWRMPGSSDPIACFSADLRLCQQKWLRKSNEKPACPFRKLMD